MNPLFSQFSAMTGSQSSNALASLLSGTSVSSAAAGLLGNAGGAATGQVPGMPFNVVLQNVTNVQSNGANVVKAASVVPGVKTAIFKQAAAPRENSIENGDQLLADTAGMVVQTTASPVAESPAPAEIDAVQAIETGDSVIAGISPSAPQPTHNPSGTSSAPNASTGAVLPDGGLNPPHNEPHGGKKTQGDILPQIGATNAGDATDANQKTLTGEKTTVSATSAAAGKASAPGNTDMVALTTAAAATEGDKSAPGEKRMLAGLEGTDPRHSAAKGINNSSTSSGHGGGQEGGAKSQPGNAQSGQPGNVTRDGSSAPAQTLAQFMATQDKSSPMLAASLLANDLSDDPAFASPYDMSVSPNQALASSVSRQAMAPAVAFSTATHAAAQVAVHIQHGLRNGQSDFNIRLDPPELGRIDVRLEFREDGRVMAVLAADNERTLHMFERHQGLLERALQDAGLKTDSGSLSFTLQQENHQQAHKDSPNQSPDNRSGLLTKEPQLAETATLIMSDRALDIRV